MSAAAARALPEEEQSRADCYALVSRLFHAAPDAALLAALASFQTGTLEQGPEPGPYVAAASALQQAAAASDAETLRAQYDEFFVGTGKAPVTPYTSAYALPHAPDRHLLALRERLRAWGLGSRAGSFEAEDHVSGVCDVMRWLIDHEKPLDEQRAFFLEFVYPGVVPFCSATARALPGFYAAVANLTRAFLDIEKQAFDMQAME